MFFLGVMLFFLFIDVWAVVISGTVSFVLLYFAKRLKNVYVKGNEIIYKGFFSKNRCLVKDIDKLGSIPFIHYLKLRDGKSIFFLNSLNEEMFGWFNANDSEEERIMKKIKK